MNFNKLEVYEFLLKIANNTNKKSIARKMLIILLEREMENEHDMPIRYLRNLLYANAKGVKLDLIQKKHLKNTG